MVVFCWLEADTILVRYQLFGLIGDVGDQVIDPLHGLVLMLIVRRHGAVAILESRRQHVGARQLGQEPADVTRPTTLCKPS
jgi:hypothetical protein